MKFGKKLKRNIALLATAVFVATANPSYATEIKVNKEEYNRAYEQKGKDIFAKIDNLEEYVLNNTISQEEMYKKLRESKVIILAECHLNPKNREHQIKILEEINNSNLVVGLELFNIDEQKHIDDYIDGKIDLNTFWERTNYNIDPFLTHFIKEFKYPDILSSLKKNKIKTVAINYKINKETKNYIKKLKILKPQMFFKMNEDKEIQQIYSKITDTDTKESNNYFKRDKLVTKIIKEHIKKGKQVAIIIGASHAEENHLPYMIKRNIGIDPVIIFQSNLDIEGDTIYINKSPKNVTFERTPSINKAIKLHEKLKELGLTEDKALLISNNFYINIPISIEDYIRGCSYYGYHPTRVTVSVEK